MSSNIEECKEGSLTWQLYNIIRDQGSCVFTLLFLALAYILTCIRGLLELQHPFHLPDKASMEGRREGH